MVSAELPPSPPPPPPPPTWQQDLLRPAELKREDSRDVRLIWTLGRFWATKNFHLKFAKNYF